MAKSKRLQELFSKCPNELLTNYATWFTLVKMNITWSRNHDYKWHFYKMSFKRKSWSFQSYLSVSIFFLGCKALHLTLITWLENKQITESAIFRIHVFVKRLRPTVGSQKRPVTWCHVTCMVIWLNYLGAPSRNLPQGINYTCYHL